MSRTTDYRENLLPRLRESPGLAMEYLNACLEDDLPTFLLALKDVVEARMSMTEMSGQTGLHRVSLYGVFSEHGNPKLRNLKKVLDALGLRLAVVEDKATARKSRAAI